MLKELKLTHFKNFHQATLGLGPFTLLVGANASGKSNLRDAFRFLHGISRGYSLAEIMGEKWGEGGVLQWRGIRGGVRETAFQGSNIFALEVNFEIDDDGRTRDAEYRIAVMVGKNGKPPRVDLERLIVGGECVFDSHPEKDRPEQPDINQLTVTVRTEAQSGFAAAYSTYPRSRPLLSQIAEQHDAHHSSVRELTRAALDAFSPARFFDLHPEAMRLPSIPGQTVVGDRGENLSSSIQAICADSHQKAVLLEWLRALTPMDVIDFEFPADAAGRILLTLVEPSGGVKSAKRKVSALSASDGTLRFLAMMAALLGPQPARLYFFEEIENGIHPTRLSLLLDLIERQVSSSRIQVVASTHSPQLLALLSEQSRRHASVIYRLDDTPGARIRRIADIPEVGEVLKKQNWGRLHESGWLENVVAFADADSEEAQV